MVCKIDIIKYMLNRFVLQGRLMKWALSLSAYSLNYLPLKAIKVHALANLLAQHPCVDPPYPFDKQVSYIGDKPWMMAFGGDPS